jgi:hypothetical protein
MSSKILDDFFKKNTVNSELPSAQALMHFHIQLESNQDVNDKIQNAMDSIIYDAQPTREQDALAERNEIESSVGCEQIIRFMRRHVDPINSHILIRKAVDIENEIVPETIRRLKTSLNGGFIELAVRILASSSINTAVELVGCFDEIRNPYAQSEILVLLGYKADESLIPWLIEKYNDFKRRYPKESYCDGAYYALFEIESRFYPTGKLKKGAVL